MLFSDLGKTESMVLSLVGGSRGMAAARSLALICLTTILAASAHAQVGHVIQLSVDGVNAATLQAEISSDTNGDYAAFQRLIDEGASTFDARADLTHTWTTPNHVSMVTGRPVSQPSGQANTIHHGFTNNGDPGPTWTLHDNTHANPNLSYVDSTFGVTHDHGLSTACYASKSKFIIFDQSYDSSSGANDGTLPPDNGKDKIDSYLFQESFSQIPGISDSLSLHQSYMAAMQAQHFDYTLLHYTDPDKAGHDFGWESSTYKTSLRHIDDYIGELLAMIEGDPTLDGNTVLIVTSDHGGTGTDHANENDSRNYTIPFFVWGPGVAAGVDLYDLNPSSRKQPAAQDPRPDFNASPQPIHNADAGNLALNLLGLPPVTGSSINALQDLKVAADAPPSLPVFSGAGLVLLLAALLLATPALLIAAEQRTVHQRTALR
jgi:hypothetical protein